MYVEIGNCNIFFRKGIQMKLMKGFEENRLEDKTLSSKDVYGWFCF